MTLIDRSRNCAGFVNRKPLIGTIILILHALLVNDNIDL